MAYLFTPPLVRDRPPFNPDSTELEKSLWAHFENRERGVNVWILANNEVVQDTATAENSNTDMTNIYPWDVNNPAAPYVTTVQVPALPAAQVATVTTVAHSNPPVAYFYGGMTWPITNAQQAILTNPANCGTGTAYAGNITSH